MPNVTTLAPDGATISIPSTGTPLDQIHLAAALDHYMTNALGSLDITRSPDFRSPDFTQSQAPTTAIPAPVLPASRPAPVMTAAASMPRQNTMTPPARPLTPTVSPSATAASNASPTARPLTPAGPPQPPYYSKAAQAQMLDGRSKKPLYINNTSGFSQDPMPFLKARAAAITHFIHLLQRGIATPTDNAQCLATVQKSMEALQSIGFLDAGDGRAIANADIKAGAYKPRTPLQKPGLAAPGQGASPTQNTLFQNVRKYTLTQAQDAGSLLQGLYELPHAVLGTAGNIVEGGWAGLRGFYDEAAGNYADSQVQAGKARASFEKTKNTVGAVYGAQGPTGDLDETVTQNSDDIGKATGHHYGVLGDFVTAAGTYKGDRHAQAMQQAGQVFKNIGSNAVEHPLTFVADILAATDGVKLSFSASAARLTEASSGFARKAAAAEAVGDTAAATTYRLAQQRALTAAQILNQGIQAIHRGQAGGAPGDYMRQTVARATHSVLAKSPGLSRAASGAVAVHGVVSHALHAPLSVLKRPMLKRSGKRLSHLPAAASPSAVIPPVAGPAPPSSVDLGSLASSAFDVAAPTTDDLGSLARGDYDIGSALRQTTPDPSPQSLPSDAATHRLAASLIDPSQREAMGLRPPASLKNSKGASIRAAKKADRMVSAPDAEGNDLWLYHRPALGKAPSVTVFSPDLTRKVQSLLGETDERRLTVGGVAIDTQNLARLKASGGIPPEIMDKLQGILDDNKNPEIPDDEQNPSFSVMTADPDLKLTEVRRTLQHEPQHVLQFKYPLDQSVQNALMTSFDTDSRTSLAWERHRRAMENLGYEDWEYFRELAPRLASGEYRNPLDFIDHMPMMSDATAEEMFTQYADAIFQHHGGKAAAEVYNASPHMRNARREKDGMSRGHTLTNFTPDNKPIYFEKDAMGLDEWFSLLEKDEPPPDASGSP